MEQSQVGQFLRVAFERVLDRCRSLMLKELRLNLAGGLEQVPLDLHLLAVEPMERSRIVEVYRLVGIELNLGRRERQVRGLTSRP